MSEKTVEQKLKECKEVIIQNMEKTIQHKMVYMYLKDRKKNEDVKQYSVNSKDGIIKLEFADHDKAEAFYKEANFSDKILLRPFNIYFNLALSENQMKKYYIQGITDENQRKIFQATCKIGPSKLYTNYGNATTSRSKLKPTGLLSFIRKDPIPKADFQRLSKDLQQIGVKIFEYVQDKGTKVSLNLVNFISDSLYNQEEGIQVFAESAAKAILEKYAKDLEVKHSSVIYKKKEVQQSKTSDVKVNKVLTSALFQFDSTQTTYQAYEKVRIGIMNQPLGRARLFFHAEENNSFMSLFTQGLAKPENLSEKEFEEQLIQGFREINKNVLQVNIYPQSYNHTYIGRVYLKNQEEGKNFLVDYSSFRSKIYKFYKETNSPPVFNINVDSKTLRRIKLAEKKAKETQDKIKKQAEANKREGRRVPGQMQIPPGVNPINMMTPSMIGPPGGMMIHPPMPGPMGNIPSINMPPPPRMGEPMMGMGGMPPHLPKGLPQMIPGQQKDLKTKISTIIKDRQRILDMDENQAKRILVNPIKELIEEQGLANAGAEAISIANTLLREVKVNDAFRFLEDQVHLRQSVQVVKNKN